MTFFALLKRHRLKLSLAFFCVVLANLSALVFPWSLKILLDQVLVQRDHSLLVRVLCMLVLSATFKALFEYAGSYVGLQIAEHVTADLREKVCRHLLSLPVMDVENYSTGQLISRTISDTDAVKRFLFSGVLDFVYSALSAVFVVVVLFFMDAKLAVLSAVLLPLFLVVYGGMGKKIKEGYGHLRQYQAELSGRLGEVFRGIRTVHAFERRTHEMRKFLAKQADILRAALKNHAGDTWFFVTAEWLSSAGLIALLAYGAGQILQGKMTVGTLMAFYTYLGFLFLPILKMTAAGGVYRDARASWQRIQEVLSREPALKETKDPLKMEKIGGHVQFQNVSFAYPGPREVLSGIDLDVSPGEWVAFVGPSGSGKTTLACLLARLWDPTSGRILVNGRDIRTFCIEDYRRQVTVVHQNDFLFADTIAANIRYADLMASDEDIAAAARATGIHLFITGLPDGYNTSVGEGGVKLSGGQRQRISLARALLKDPAILILDEPLSAVDTQSVNEIIETVRKIRKHRTTFMIAHRTSMVQDTDKIVRINNGKIEGGERHQGLLAQPHAI